MVNNEYGWLCATPAEPGTCLLTVVMTDAAGNGEAEIDTERVVVWLTDLHGRTVPSTMVAGTFAAPNGDYDAIVWPNGDYKVVQSRSEVTRRAVLDYINEQVRT